MQQRVDHKNRIVFGSFFPIFIIILIFSGCSKNRIDLDVTVTNTQIPLTSTSTITPTQTVTPTITPTFTNTTTPQPTNTSTSTPTSFQLSYGQLRLSNLDSPYQGDIVIDNADELTLRKTNGNGKVEQILFSTDNEIIVLSDIKTCYLDAVTLEEKRCFSIRKPDGLSNSQWVALSTDLQHIFSRTDSYYELIDTTSGASQIFQLENITSWSFSPGGDSLATNNGILNIETGSFIHNFGDEVIDRSIFKNAYSPNGRYLATYSPAGGGNAISLIDVVSGSVLFRISNGGNFFNSTRSIMKQVSFSPDSKLVAFALNGQAANFEYLLQGNGLIQVYDIEKREVIWQSDGVSEITDFSFSPQGNLFAFTSELGRTINVWDTEDWELVGELRSDTLYGYSHLKFSPNGRKILATTSYRSALGGMDCMNDPHFTLYMWDLDLGNEPVFAVPGGANANQSLIDFSPYGDLFIYAAGVQGCDEFYETRMVLVDTNTLEEIADYSLRSVVSLSGGPNVILTGNASGQLFIWDGTTGDLIRSFGDTSGIILDIRAGYPDNSGTFPILVTSVDRLGFNMRCVNFKTQLWSSTGQLYGTVFEGWYIQTFIQLEYSTSGYCIYLKNCDGSEEERVVDSNNNIICNNRLCRLNYSCYSFPSQIGSTSSFHNREGLIFFRDNPTIVITRMGGYHTYNPYSYAFDIWGIGP